MTWAALPFIVWFIAVVWRVYRTSQIKPLPAPPVDPGPLHHYYREAAITKAVEDVFSPIEDVIRAVERECDEEMRISKSYREKPELLYEGHPWIRFVRTGSAEWLGWPIDFVPGPSPVDRRRMWPDSIRANRITAGTIQAGWPSEEFIRPRAYLDGPKECGWMGCGRAECARYCNAVGKPLDTP